MFTIVATETARLNRTVIRVYNDNHGTREELTVFSVWPEDWNEALRARGYDVHNAWIGGAPQWVPLPAGLDDRESATYDAVRV